MADPAQTKLYPAPRAAADVRQSGGKGFRWPLIILGLLGLNVVITAALITLSSRDPGLMIETDYDQRALQWDAFARQRLASDILGWTAQITIDAAGPQPRLVVRLVDRDGNAVIADSAEAIAFPQSHASKSQVLTLRAADGEPATRTAPIVLTHPGLWEVRLTAKRDGKTFMSTVSVASGSAPAIAPEHAPASSKPAPEHN